MVKCKLCKNSIKRRNELCRIHNTEKNRCVSCKDVVKSYEKITLINCGHIICKMCLSDDVYSNQWFRGFSTENTLKCPECTLQLSDEDWCNVMNYLVAKGRLQRDVVYAYYLEPIWINKLYRYVEFGKCYTARERNALEDWWNNDNGTYLWNLIHPDYDPLIVYFFKVNPFDYSTYVRRNFYTFKIDYNYIKSNNEALFKTLIEYVFHPDRVKRLGGMDYIEQLD